MKLTMTGTHPTQSYGHVAQGASTAQMFAMTKNIKDTTPFAGTRACTTTVVAWLFGPNANLTLLQEVDDISGFVRGHAGADPWRPKVVYLAPATESAHPALSNWRRSAPPRALRSVRS